MITIVAFYSKALDDFYYWESNDKMIFIHSCREHYK